MVKSNSTTLQIYSLAKIHVFIDHQLVFRGSPPYMHFGTWKKLCFMKLMFVGL